MGTPVTVDFVRTELLCLLPGAASLALPLRCFDFSSAFLQA